MAKDSSFWKTRFRMIQPNLRKIDAATLQPEAFVEQIAEFGANAILINGGGIVAWYRTDHPYQSVNEYMQGDYLGEMLQAAHARNMKVLIRMDISKSFPHVLEEHPDWFRRDVNGEVKKHWEMLQTCPTGPFWEEYNFQVIEELMKRYPVDGFFYNAFHFDSCYCDRCRKLFSQATGYELPLREDWNDPAWVRFVQYRYDKMADYTARLQRFIHQCSPGTALTIDTHMTNDNPHFIRDSGWNTASFADSTDCITVEAFNMLTRSQPKWFYWAGEEVKMGSHHNNVCVLLIHTGAYSRRHAPPAAQIGYDMMQIAANGGSPAIAFSGTFEQNDRKAIPMIKSVMQFLQANEDEYKAMRPKADIAILFSQQSADYYGREKPNDSWQSHYRGVYEILTESHVPFTVLHEGALARVDLRQFRCILLPNIAVLSPSDADLLDRYVEQGGHVIATYETGLYDSEGNARPDGQILKSIGGSIRERKNVDCAYLWIEDKEMLPSFPVTDLLPLSGELLVRESQSQEEREAKELIGLKLIPPVKNNTPEYAYWDQVGPENGLVIRTFGSGTTAYLPWEIGKLYHRHGVPEYKQLLVDLVNRCAGQQLFQVQAPSSVQFVCADRPAGGYLLHLLNATGVQSKPLTEIVPVHDIAIRIAQPIRTARSLVSGETFRVEKDGKYSVLTLPKLMLFEAIVVE